MAETTKYFKGLLLVLAVMLPVALGWGAGNPVKRAIPSPSPVVLVATVKLKGGVGW